MAFIAAYWWLWLVMTILLFLFAFASFFSGTFGALQKSEDKDSKGAFGLLIGGIVGMIVVWLMASASSLLLVISIILNIIDYCKK